MLPSESNLMAEAQRADEEYAAAVKSQKAAPKGHEGYWNEKVSQALAAKTKALAALQNHQDGVDPTDPIPDGHGPPQDRIRPQFGPSDDDPDDKKPSGRVLS